MGIWDVLRNKKARRHLSWGNIAKLMAEIYRTHGSVVELKIPFRKQKVVALIGETTNNWFHKRGSLHLRSKDYMQDLETLFGASRTLPGMDGAEHFRLRKSLNRGYSRASFESKLSQLYFECRSTLQDCKPGETLGGTRACRILMSRQVSKLALSLATAGDVQDVLNHAPGIREIQLELRPEARTLGLTLEDLASQTRAAFFGAEALRVQRDGEEVRVYVRLPPEERDSITDIERYLVRTPNGAEVPLNQVASLKTGNTSPAVRRKDGQRVVTVIADVDPRVISAGEANGIVTDRILPELTGTYPDLTYTQGGEQQQQVESLGALYRGFVLAMLLIFALLAIPLRSYTKPSVIMSIIPFGLIGVMIGHLVLQIPISAATIMGVLGLSGVLVNDSLVMVDLIEQRRMDGDSPRDAIIEGAKGRFRPILLTSVTTFLGFTPLILERAIQAQFLMPFAAALGVGMLITTVILMLVVPAITTMHARVRV